MSKKLKELLEEKDYLIKSIIKKLNIYTNYDKFYHIGIIALYHAFQNYDGSKDNKSFDIYAYYIILKYLKNELNKINKLEKLEMWLNLYNNVYLAPIIEEDLINKLEFVNLQKNLSDTQLKLINLKRLGYKNKEINKVLNLSEEKVEYQIKLAFNNILTIINKYNII